MRVVIGGDEDQFRKLISLSKIPKRKVTKSEDISGSNLRRGPWEIYAGKQGIRTRAHKRRGKMIEKSESRPGGVVCECACRFSLCVFCNALLCLTWHVAVGLRRKFS